MARPVDVVRSRGGSLLRALLACFITEHTCVPPDEVTAWQPVPDERSRELSARTVYSCPECGQHLARVENRQLTPVGNYPVAVCM